MVFWYLKVRYESYVKFSNILKRREIFVIKNDVCVWCVSYCKYCD